MTHTCKLISIILFASILSGCLSTPFFRNISSIFKSSEQQDSYSERNSNIKIIPLRKPVKGEHLKIRDPEKGTEYTVKIGDVYTSASGKLCGRYTLEGENLERDSGLVCFDQDEEWIKVPLQLPINK